MKALSILLMLAGVFMILAFGFMYLLGFAMSFDAPGSDKSPEAWRMRILMLLPLLIFLVTLVLSFKAFGEGNYKKSVLLGAVSPVIGLILFGSMTLTSMKSLNQYNDEIALQKEYDAKYPIQKYLRLGEAGTDTIIVWPNGIVAYRLHIPDMPKPWGGPLGDLSEDRTTILFSRTPDTKIKFEDLSLFLDENGRRFTDVYEVR